VKRARPASDLVREEWRRRIEAEYRSAALTQHLGLWLTQIGASPDLVRQSLRIARDELTHAALSRSVYASAGGRLPAALERSTLALPRMLTDPLEIDVARACVATFCLGETVAVPLFAELRRGCTVLRARAALDRVLADEVRHREFGWTLLGWLLAQPFAGVLVPVIERELPRMIEDLRTSYAPGWIAGQTTLSADDRAWGLMPGARYAEILERSLARDHLPRFRRAGLRVTARLER
jgi:hypothetical protein